MKEFINWLGTNSPIIVGILLAVYLIICIYKDMNVLWTMVKNFFGLSKRGLKWYRKRKRNSFYKDLCNKDYILWQKQVLKLIYSPLIKECEEHGVNIDFTTLQLDKKIYDYEAITLFDNREELLSYPFKGLFSKEELVCNTDISSSMYDFKGLSNKGKLLQQEYYNMIKDNLRYPNRLGYMLDNINLADGIIKSVVSYSGCYKNNILQSHVLEFELYKLYKKSGKKTRDKLLSAQNAREIILNKLEIRNAIHKSFANEYEILISGKHRTSLLGVQIFVLVKNCKNKYQALRIRRSQKVAAKAGYLQFIPSGGFESCNDDCDFDAQWANYSLSKVLFKELMEECFGQDEVQYTGRLSPEKVYFNDKVTRLISLIEENKAQFEFLGTAMSLVGLRHEFSFILKIDDCEFSKNLLCNDESHSAINLVSIEQLENEKFWMYNQNPEADNFVNDFDLLNCTSASLFQLARGSKLYQQALKESRAANS